MPPYRLLTFSSANEHLCGHNWRRHPTLFCLTPSLVRKPGTAGPSMCVVDPLAALHRHTGGSRGHRVTGCRSRAVSRQQTHCSITPLFVSFRVAFLRSRPGPCVVCLGCGGVWGCSRQGQDKKLLVVRYVMADTIEQELYEKNVMPLEESERLVTVTAAATPASSSSSSAPVASSSSSSSSSS